MVQCKWYWNVTPKCPGVCKMLVYNTCCKMLLILYWTLGWCRLCVRGLGGGWFKSVSLHLVSVVSWQRTMIILLYPYHSWFNRPLAHAELHCAEHCQLTKPEWQCQVDLLQENVLQKWWCDFISFTCGPYCCSQNAAPTHLLNSKPGFSMMFALMNIWTLSCWTTDQKDRKSKGMSEKQTWKSAILIYLQFYCGRYWQ